MDRTFCVLVVDNLPKFKKAANRKSKTLKVSQAKLKKENDTFKHITSGKTIKRHLWRTERKMLSDQNSKSWKQNGDFLRPAKAELIHSLPPCTTQSTASSSARKAMTSRAPDAYVDPHEWMRNEHKLYLNLFQRLSAI